VLCSCGPRPRLRTQRFLRTGHADFPIRLSDKTSRLRPRLVVAKPAQTYEPEVPVKVREMLSGPVCGREAGPSSSLVPTTVSGPALALQELVRMVHEP
jgi:hypothetical protein